jgi:chromosome segregation ATPase
MDLSRNHRDEDYLKKGEAQIFQLQQQVDEVRRLLREQIARQHSVEDNSKQNEARYYQIRDTVEKLGADLTQSLQVRSMEDQRLKQEVADMQARISEPGRYIRELRSQISELNESRRKDTEQIGLDKLNLDKLDMSIRDGQSQITRLDGSIKDLREAIKITANAQEFYQLELQRVLDIIHNNEQIVRRQAEEFQESIKALREEVALFSNRISRLEDLQRQDSNRLEELPALFETLRHDDERVMRDIVRVERQMTERFSAHQDRLEEIRQQTEGQFFAVNQVVTGQSDSSQTRFEQLDERIRAINASSLELQLRIEQIKQVEDSEIYDLYNMEEQRLARQIEVAQAEYDALRQQRARSQAGGLAGKRAARARAKTRTEGESPEPTSPTEDSSI